MKKIQHRSTAIMVSFLLALSITGCSANSNSTSQDDQQSDNQQTTEQQAPEKQVQFFDECSNLPTPDSVVDASKEGNSTSTSVDSSGNTTTYKYTYDIQVNDSTSASDQITSYINKLQELGLTVTQEADGKWTVLSDETKIAELEYGSSNNTLTVNVFDENSRSTVKSIALNQPVTTDDYTFTITNINWSKEVLPPNTADNYLYYQEQPNKTYCILTGTFKYTGSTQFDFGNTSVMFENMNGKYEFSGSAEYANSGIGMPSNSVISKTYSLQPLDEVPLYIYASIPDEVANAFTGGTMTWTFRNGTQYQLNLQ